MTLDRDDIELVAATVAKMLAERADPIARDGIALAGTYDPTDGTVMVAIGDTACLFTDEGDIPVARTRVPLGVMHYGDQYGPVGDERVTLVRTESGYIALITHDRDDSPNAPAGERWITHRKTDGSGNIDSYTKYTNDAKSAGDKKGAVLQNGGAFQQLTTTGNGTPQAPTGHSVTLDDIAKALTVLSAGGMFSKYDDTVKQITHQAASNCYTLYNGLGDVISHVAPSIGLGDLFANLDATERAINQTHLQTNNDNIRKMVGNALQQAAKAAIGAGVTNATAWLAAIQAGLPSLSFTDLTGSIAAATTANGSSVVRLVT